MRLRMAPELHRIGLVSLLWFFLFLLFVSHIPAIQGIFVALVLALVVTVTVSPSGTELTWN